MTSLDSLLVATDHSADGHDAVRRAALLAHEHGARLHILHLLDGGRRQILRRRLFPALDIDREAAQARNALQRMAAEISRSCDVSVSVEVVVGDPGAALQQASQRADLVVIGRRGRGWLGRLRVGRTVDRMLVTCRRPVLVVRTPVAQAYQRILVPIDFTDGADAALRVAARMRREADLHVVHAIDSRRDAILRDADVPEHLIREARGMEEAGTRARIRRKFSRLGLDGAPVSLALTYGRMAPSTLRHARRLEADLIVAAREGGSTTGRFLFGGVGRRILFGSPCDTLIVPVLPDGSAPRAAATTWIHDTARFTSRRTS